MSLERIAMKFDSHVAVSNANFGKYTKLISKFYRALLLHKNPDRLFLFCNCGTATGKI